MRRRALCATLALLAVAPASASALVVTEVGGLNQPANGIALGPDGNIWAAEPLGESLVRMTPSGQVLGHLAVGGIPVSVAAGPGNKVWATVPNEDKLVWFDSTLPSPGANSVSTGPSGDCGPVAIVSGGNGFMYYSKPASGGSCTSEVGRVKDNGTGAQSFPGLGEAFDLAVRNGKVFVPDFEGDAVRRVSPALSAIEAKIDTSPGGSPNGIAIDATGQVTVSLFSSGQLARFADSAPNGASAASLAPSGGTISDAFGVVTGADGRSYVASSGNAQMLAVGSGPSYAFTSLPAGAEPWDVASGPHGDLWVTDQGSARLFRISQDPAPALGSIRISAPAAPVKPRLVLSGKKKQKLGKFVEVKTSCPTGACTVSATSTMTIRPSAGRKGRMTHPELKPARGQIATGRAKVLKLRIPRKAKKAALKMLKSHGRASAKIWATAEDASGTSSAEVLIVSLRK